MTGKTFFTKYFFHLHRYISTIPVNFEEMQGKHILAHLSGAPPPYLQRFFWVVPVVFALNPELKKINGCFFSAAVASADALAILCAVSMIVATINLN